MSHIKVTNTGCKAAKSFWKQLHAAIYEGDEDWMWRQLPHMTDAQGRTYRCRYKVVVTEHDFYTRMTCTRKQRRVTSWVNSAR